MSLARNIEHMFEGDLATLPTADLRESAVEWRAGGARADVPVHEVAMVYAAAPATAANAPWCSAATAAPRSWSSRSPSSR